MRLLALCSKYLLWGKQMKRKIKKFAEGGALNTEKPTNSGGLGPKEDVSRTYSGSLDPKKGVSRTYSGGLSPKKDTAKERRSVLQDALYGGAAAGARLGSKLNALLDSVGETSSEGYAKGGAVRGAGKAVKGVRKCKMC